MGTLSVLAVRPRFCNVPSKIMMPGFRSGPVRALSGLLLAQSWRRCFDALRRRLAASPAGSGGCRVGDRRLAPVAWVGYATCLKTTQNPPSGGSRGPALAPFSWAQCHPARLSRRSSLADPLDSAPRPVADPAVARSGRRDWLRAMGRWRSGDPVGDQALRDRSYGLWEQTRPSPFLQEVAFLKSDPSRTDLPFACLLSVDGSAFRTWFFCALDRERREHHAPAGSRVRPFDPSGQDLTSSRPGWAGLTCWRLGEICPFYLSLSDPRPEFVRGSSKLGRKSHGGQPIWGSGYGTRRSAQSPDVSDSGARVPLRRSTARHAGAADNMHRQSAFIGGPASIRPA